MRELNRRVRRERISVDLEAKIKVIYTCAVKPLGRQREEALRGPNSISIVPLTELSVTRLRSDGGWRIEPSRPRSSDSEYQQWRASLHEQVGDWRGRKIRSLLSMHRPGV